MSDPYETHASTPAVELEFQIVSSTVPKNEREWWAHHEIQRLREQLIDLHQDEKDGIEYRRVLAEEIDRLEAELADRNAELDAAKGLAEKAEAKLAEARKLLRLAHSWCLVDASLWVAIDAVLAKEQKP